MLEDNGGVQWVLKGEGGLGSGEGWRLKKRSEVGEVKLEEVWKWKLN